MRKKEKEKEIEGNSREIGAHVLTYNDFVEWFVTQSNAIVKSQTNLNLCPLLLIWTSRRGGPASEYNDRQIMSIEANVTRLQVRDLRNM